MPSYDLTQANSSSVVQEIQGGKSIVLHHMNSCIHCELFRPIWKKVCDNYKNKKTLLISVEYSSMGMLPKNMQNVQGFPTLRAYNNARPIAEFNDVRTYDAVIDFVEKYGNTQTSKQKDSKAKPLSNSRSTLKKSAKQKNKE